MSVVQDIDYLAVAPPLVVALMAVAVLVVDTLLPAARREVTGWLALGGLVVAGALFTTGLTLGSLAALWLTRSRRTG